jgi:hypothetical protein
MSQNLRFAAIPSRFAEYRQRASPRDAVTRACRTNAETRTARPLGLCSLQRVQGAIRRSVMAGYVGIPVLLDEGFDDGREVGRDALAIAVRAEIEVAAVEGDIGESPEPECHEGDHAGRVRAAAATAGPHIGVTAPDWRTRRLGGG